MDAARQELLTEHRNMFDYSQAENTRDSVLYYASSGSRPYGVSSSGLDKTLAYMTMLGEYDPEEGYVSIVPFDPDDLVHQVLLTERQRIAS